MRPQIDLDKHKVIATGNRLRIPRDRAADCRVDLRLNPTSICS